MKNPTPQRLPTSRNDPRYNFKIAFTASNTHKIMTSNYQSKLVSISILALTAIFFISCNNKSPKKSKGYILTESGLQYKVLKEGKGEKAVIGDTVLLFETTSYRDGTVLYSNENSKSPVEVILGKQMVTQAVEEGLNGMKTGEIRQIIAPPYLVKREIYPDNVSPDSTLVIKLIASKVLKK